MIVCSCHGITDTEIRQELSPEGQGQCLAGTSCGNCLPLVADIVRKLRNTETCRGGKSTTRNSRRSAAPETGSQTPA